MWKLDLCYYSPFRTGDIFTRRYKQPKETNYRQIEKDILDEVMGPKVSGSQYNGGNFHDSFVLCQFGGVGACPDDLGTFIKGPKAWVENFLRQFISWPSWLPYSTYLYLDFHLLLLCSMTKLKEHSREILYHLSEGEDDDLLVLFDNLQVLQVPIAIQ